MDGKKVKRLLAVLLAGVMVASTAACGGKGGSDSESSAGDKSEASSQEVTAAEGEEGALVVGIYGGLDSLNPWTSGRITKDMVTYVL